MNSDTLHLATKDLRLAIARALLEQAAVGRGAGAERQITRWPLTAGADPGAHSCPPSSS